MIRRISSSVISSSPVKVDLMKSTSCEYCSGVKLGMFLGYMSLNISMKIFWKIISISITTKSRILAGLLEIFNTACWSASEVLDWIKTNFFLKLLLPLCSLLNFPWISMPVRVIRPSLTEFTYSWWCQALSEWMFQKFIRWLIKDISSTMVKTCLNCAIFCKSVVYCWIRKHFFRSLSILHEKLTSFLHILLTLINSFNLYTQHRLFGINFAPLILFKLKCSNVRLC